jgi:hypothetical protein
MRGSHPVPSPFHPLGFPFPLLLHTRFSRKGFQACLHPRRRHRQRARLFVRHNSVAGLGDMSSYPLRPEQIRTYRRPKRKDSTRTRSGRRIPGPRPAATGEALRHERAERRGQPYRGATSGTYLLHMVVLADSRRSVQRSPPQLLTWPLPFSFHLSSHRLYARISPSSDAICRGPSRTATSFPVQTFYRTSNYFNLSFSPIKLTPLSCILCIRSSTQYEYGCSPLTAFPPTWSRIRYAGFL